MGVIHWKKFSDGGNISKYLIFLKEGHGVDKIVPEETTRLGELLYLDRGKSVHQRIVLPAFFTSHSWGQVK